MVAFLKDLDVFNINHLNLRITSNYGNSTSNKIGERAEENIKLLNITYARSVLRASIATKGIIKRNDVVVYHHTEN